MITFIKMVGSYLVMLGLASVGAFWALGFATDMVAHRYMKSVRKRIF